ncbi:C2H2-type zinc finger protein [Haladaptatus sp. ZSTT2]
MDEAERRHTCHVCGRVFESETALDEHVRTVGLAD